MDACLARRNRFCSKWFSAVCDLMEDAYPELNETADQVSEAIHLEEKQFAHTLERLDLETAGEQLVTDTLKRTRASYLSSKLSTQSGSAENLSL